MGEISSQRSNPREVSEGVPSDSFRRKKLEMLFLMSDERISSSHLGISPVDLRGRPIENLSKTGGWTACFFILGNEMAERLAYFGLAANMVAYLFYVMHRPFTSAASAVNTFLGISQISSVLGGFLADAYLGRYWTIAIFTSLYLIGLIGITVSASSSIFLPDQSSCNELSLLLGGCAPAKPWQTSFLFVFLYVTSLGSAGIRPCVSSFGADQFDPRRKDYNALLDRFFNFFYLAVTIGGVGAFTIVVYVQMKLGWNYAFGLMALATGLSNALFFSGTPLYRHRLPSGSALTRVAQVLVAAFRKRHHPFSCSKNNSLYEVLGERSAIKGSGKIAHTDDFRWLDKAALQVEETPEPSQWKLCTVTQVEEVKILIKLLPITACTILLSIMLTGFITLSIQQVYTLNTHMGKLKLPVTSIPVFPALTILLVLSLYYSTFAPLSRRITGHPQGASQLQRIGLGLGISILSEAFAGFFERYRRGYAVRHGYEFVFLTAMPGLSVFWLMIPYCLIGLAEVFTVVGLLEFLYQEAPDSMKSIGSAYAAVAGGLGCFLATLLNNIVKAATGDDARGRPSWLAQNVNEGRFDYYFWLLSVMGLINFCCFLFCARRYKYRTKGIHEVGSAPSPVTK